MSENVVSSPFHFFSCNEFLVCLVCQEAISREPSQLCTDVNYLLSSHINAKNHQENVKALFKFCVPGWKGNYLSIVQNLVFDITIEKEESSYISEVGNHLFCSVCEESIVQLSDTKDIKIISLLKHVCSVSHLNKLKNVNWVFCLDDKVSFIMFFESVAYCSICKDNVQGSRVCPVRRAVKHLKDFHPNKKVEQNTNMYKTPTRNENTDSSSDKTGLCHSFKMISLSEKNPLGIKNFSGDTYFLSETYSKFGEFAGSEIKESFSNLVDFQRDSFTCPECGKSITIYNENVDFSLDLHEQTHKTLSGINGSSCLNYQEDADFVCPLCQETIQVFNKNLEFSYNIHFENNHTHNRFTSADVETKNKFDFLSRVFETLPKKMQEHQGVFVMDGNEVVCKLCNCVVYSTKHVPEAGIVFSEHISNSFHIDQFNVSAELLEASYGELMEKTSSHKETNHQSSLLEILSKKSVIINKNKQFIEKQKIHYLCTICEKHICYSPKQDVQIFNFHSHLNSKVHETSLVKIKKRELHTITEVISNSVKQMNSNSSLDSIKNGGNKIPQTNPKKQNEFFENMLNKSPVIEANKHFIGKLGGTYVCIICGVYISYSPKEKTQILNFVSHLNSNLHNKYLKEIKKQELNTIPKLLPNAVKQMNSNSSLDSIKNGGNKIPQTNPKKQNEFFEIVLKKSPVIEANKHFIGKLGGTYVCTICGVYISYSPKEKTQILNFVSHLNGNLHNKYLKEIKKQELNTIPKLLSNAVKQMNNNSSLDSIKNGGNKIPQTNPKKQNDFFENMLNKSPVIEANKHFIGKLGGRYVCTICGVYISYSPQEDTQVFNFLSHLQGVLHKTSVRRVNKQEHNPKVQMNTSPKTNDGKIHSHSKELDNKSVSQNEIKIQNVVEQVTTDKTIFESNKKFVEKKEKTYYCTLCDKHISYSPKETSQMFNLVLHFKGYSHVNSQKSMITESEIKGEDTWKRDKVQQPGLLDEIDTLERQLECRGSLHA